MTRENFERMTISIHAPRVGSDMGRPNIGSKTTDFNPRSPCGERQTPFAWWITRATFQSTLPVWGATVSGILTCNLVGISIHAPRVGSDASAR